MSVPEAGNTLQVPAYSNGSEAAVVDISWSQMLRTKTARYYIVKANNQSKGNVDVLLYIQDRFYKDESGSDFIGKLPNARKDGDNFIIAMDEHFQYGQRSKDGLNRFVVLHDKSNKMFQHRFMLTTIQGKAADWAKRLAGDFGAGTIADEVHKLCSGFVGDYLRTV